MEPHDLTVRLPLVVLIIVVNAFFAGAEVALLSVRNSRLRQMAEDGRGGGQAAALSLLANPERLLSVTQVGVTLASLGLGWAGEDTIYSVPGGVPARSLPAGVRTASCTRSASCWPSPPSATSTWCSAKWCRRTWPSIRPTGWRCWWRRRCCSSTGSRCRSWW